MIDRPRGRRPQPPSPPSPPPLVPPEQRPAYDGYRQFLARQADELAVKRAPIDAVLELRAIRGLLECILEVLERRT